MMRSQFDNMVNILATWDNNAHNMNDYRRTMLYGMNNVGNDPLNQPSPELVAAVNTAYNKILTDYGYTTATLDTYYYDQLHAPSNQKVPSIGCP